MPIHSAEFNCKLCTLQCPAIFFKVQSADILKIHTHTQVQSADSRRKQMHRGPTVLRRQCAASPHGQPSWSTDRQADRGMAVASPHLHRLPPLRVCQRKSIFTAGHRNSRQMATANLYLRPPVARRLQTSAVTFNLPLLENEHTTDGIISAIAVFINITIIALFRPHDGPVPLSRGNREKHQGSGDADDRPTENHQEHHIGWQQHQPRTEPQQQALGGAQEGRHEPRHCGQRHVL